MIIVTGAAGFISSCMVAKLNQENFRDLILVDAFDRKDKVANYRDKAYRELVERSLFFEWVAGKERDIQCIIHLGARTDTAEMDKGIFDELNVSYSQKMWDLCSEHQIPLIYASSAATYGGGEYGFRDDHAISRKLQPLNPYGESKQVFDLWALEQKKAPFFWAGIKFFNVYGPNEYHKGRMASVIYHTYHQINKTGGMKLFRSHREGIADGHQQRDFIYVKDVVEVLFYLMTTRKQSGIYNLGTGKARSFLDLATNVFHAQSIEPKISFVDTPEDIRDKYQYFTEADMSKLKTIGFDQPFHSLEDGINDYVQEYLMQAGYW